MDLVYDAFLRRQLVEGLALAADSDLLQLQPLPPGLIGTGSFEAGRSSLLVKPAPTERPPDHFLARFRCRGLVRESSGEIVHADCFDVGVWYPPDFLRRVNPFRVLAWLGPRNVWHPNISNDPPLICIGHLAPATPLVEVLERCFEVITFGNVSMSEGNALNPDACAWARRHQHLFPVDARPLRRRSLDLDVVEISP